MFGGEFNLLAERMRNLSFFWGGGADLGLNRNLASTDCLLFIRHNKLQTKTSRFRFPISTLLHARHVDVEKLSPARSVS